MLDEITKIGIDNLFRMNGLSAMPYEKPDNTWVFVSIEMDLNVMQYERNVYTVFDLLSDWGGLNGIIITVFSVISATWNYLSFDNFMVSRLFKIKKPDEEIVGVTQYFN